MTFENTEVSKKLIFEGNASIAVKLRQRLCGETLCGHFLGSYGTGKASSLF